MFLINGYEIKLINVYNSESFEAYKGVYKSKICLIIAEFFLSVLVLVIGKRSKNKGVLYNFIFWISFILALVFLFILIFILIIPKGPLM